MRAAAPAANVAAMLPEPAPPAFNPADPRWLAHRYDRTADQIVYRWTEREAHRAAAFLTDAELGDDAPTIRLARAEAVAAAAPGRLHFLFHSAFCNSTLLVRALDQAGVAMGLSEPVILNDLVGMRRRRELDGRALGERLDHALRLLARPWGAGEAVVVKPSNILNPLAVGMMALRPDAQALLLYTPLDNFLASVARKGLWCRLWVRELLEGLLTDGAVDLGFAPSDYFRQSDLQVAAVAWLAQHKLFHALVARYGAARVRTLDSEWLMRDRLGVMDALVRHFTLADDPALGARLADGPAFSRHSKSGTTFSAADRARDRAAAAAAHGEEIAQVSAWAEAVAANVGLSLTLPAPLLN